MGGDEVSAMGCVFIPTIWNQDKNAAAKAKNPAIHITVVHEKHEMRKTIISCY